MITSELVAESAATVAPPAENAVPDVAGENGNACVGDIAVLDIDVPVDPDAAVPLPLPLPLPVPPVPPCGVSVEPVAPVPPPLSCPVISERSVCATFTASAFLR